MSKPRMSLALEREMAKSGGKARVVKVPENMRPTVDSLRHLENEISAQIKSNKSMCMYASDVKLPSV